MSSGQHPNSSLGDLSCLPTALLCSVLEFLPTSVVVGVVGTVSKGLAAAVKEMPGFCMDLKTMPAAARQDQIQRALLTKCTQFTQLQTVVVENFQVVDDQWVQSLLDMHRDSLLEVVIAGGSIEKPEISSATLQRLALERLPQLTSIQLHCSNLHELNLTHTFVSDLELHAILPCVSPTLRTLRLHKCKNVRAPALDLPHVRLLDLSCTAVQDRSIKGILSGCPELRVLFLKECHNLKSPHFESTSLALISLSSVKRLHVPTFACPNLRQIDLSHTSVRDDAIDGILQSVPQIHVLILSGCWDITKPGVGDDAFVGTYELEHIDVSSTSIEGPAILQLVASSERLRTLRARITNIHVDLDEVPYIPTRRHLLDLNVASSDMTDSQLQRLLMAFPALTSLNIGRCGELVAPWGPELVQVGACSSLTELDCSVTGLDDQAMADMISGLPRLRTLTAIRCFGLRHFVLRSRSVETVVLGACRKLQTLQVADAPSLRHLDISASPVLTAAVIPHQLCPRLRVLVIRELANDLKERLLHLAAAGVRLVTTGGTPGNAGLGAAVPSLSDIRPVTPPARQWKAPPPEHVIVRRHLEEETKEQEEKRMRQKLTAALPSVSPGLPSASSGPMVSPSVSDEPEVESIEVCVMKDRIMELEAKLQDPELSQIMVFGLKRQLAVLRGKLRRLVRQTKIKSPT